MEEVWKAIEGYEGRYEISSLGRVKSLNYGGHKGIQKIMTPHADQKGYLRIGLTKDGVTKTFKVHRLVAENFIENPKNLPEVNHKNGNKQKNHVDNLEWSTSSDNTKHAYQIGLKEKTRERTRIMGNTIGKKMFEIYRETQKTPVIAKNLLSGEKLYFNSQADAGRILQIAQPNIHKVLIGKRKSTGGYSFDYAAKVVMP